MPALRRLISHWSGAFVVEGANREASMAFSLARSVDIVTVEKIDDQLAAYGKELRDEKTTSQRTRQLVALVDDALEQRRMLTHG